MTEELRCVDDSPPVCSPSHKGKMGNYRTVQLRTVKTKCGIFRIQYIQQTSALSTPTMELSEYMQCLSNKCSRPNWC